MKKIIIIAGPNGAGKTTFARSFLPAEANCPHFVNADLIAAGLSPFAPDQAAVRAARLMLAEIERLTKQGENFAFETTLSGLSYLQHIKRWHSLGYHISLFFLSLPSPEIAIQRVAQRVRQGGHSIPENVIRRRFKQGLLNLQNHYCVAVDDWTLYDNKSDTAVIIDWRERNK